METMKRPAVTSRRIDAPVLALSIDKEVKRLKHEPEWISGRENGITLAKYPHLRAVLVALKKGTNLREHTVEGPLSLYVVSGKISLTVSGSRHSVSGRELLTLRKTVPHDIKALSDSVFLLMIMRP